MENPSHAIKQSRTSIDENTLNNRVSLSGQTDILNYNQVPTITLNLSKPPSTRRHIPGRIHHNNNDTTDITSMDKMTTLNALGSIDRNSDLPASPIRERDVTYDKTDSSKS